MTWGIREGALDVICGLDQSCSDLATRGARQRTGRGDCNALDKTGSVHTGLPIGPQGNGPPSPSPPKGAVLEGAVY